MFLIVVTLTSAALFSKACGSSRSAPKRQSGTRACRRGAFGEAATRREAGPPRRAQSLSTICVDKVVHSLQKKILSGLRKRLFCRCPQFEPTFLSILNNALRNLQTGTVCLINGQARRKALLWIV